jgi:hypothetical protein
MIEQRSEVDHDVAVARTAVVVLDDDARRGRPLGADRLDGRKDVIDRPDILPPERDGHSGPRQHPPTFALEAEPAKLGSGAVDRDAERDRKGDFGAGDVPRLHQGRSSADASLNVLEQVGPVEELRSHRPGRPVVDVEQRDSRPHLLAPVGWHEVEIAIEGGCVGAAGGDEHDLA